ncbi:MAG: porin [Aquisalimonadaceae bacterium]
MKKSLIALAVVSAFAAGAANAEVRIYGNLDVGIGSAVADNDNSNGFFTNNLSTSELGFMSSYELGNTGLTSHLQLGGQIAGNSAGTTGTGPGSYNLDRHKLVGISGDFGRVDAGTRLNPAFAFWGSTFAMGGNSVAVNGQFAAGVLNTWVPNTVTYSSPNLNGLTAQVMYGFNGAGNAVPAAPTVPDNDQTFTSGAIAYSTGPLRVGVSYQNHDDPADTIGNTTTVVGGTYDIGALRLSANYMDADVDAIDGADNVTMSAGARYAVTSQVAVGGTYMSHDSGASLVNLQAHYAPVPQTTFYAMVSIIENDEIENANDLQYRTFWGEGTRVAAGDDDSGFTVGVVQRF